MLTRSIFLILKDKIMNKIKNYFKNYFKTETICQYLDCIKIPDKDVNNFLALYSKWKNDNDLVAKREFFIKAQFLNCKINNEYEWDFITDNQVDYYFKLKNKEWFSKHYIG